MDTRFSIGRGLCLGLAAAWLLAAGCNREESAGGVDNGATVSADSDAKVLAILARADAADGTTDRVVTKCPGCSLVMNGKAEHDLKAHGYTLHFCSGMCRDGFAGNLTQSILALKVPGG